MPIGKNALKRVNNGYSNVATSAPDMEHSAVAEPEANKEKPAVKKPTRKTNSQPSAKTTAKETSKSTASKAEKKLAKKEADTHPDGFAHIGLGDELPIYLL